MMEELKDIIVGYDLTSKYLISINDYLQTFEEFKAVQISSTSIKDLKAFPCTDHYQGGTFLLTKSLKKVPYALCAETLEKLCMTE